MRQGAPIASNSQTLRQRGDARRVDQDSRACSLIAAIAILKPPLVSDEPETRVTLRVSMSLPTVCSAMPPTNSAWWPLAVGSVACGVTVMSVILSSARVSSTVIDSVPLGAW